MAASARLEGNPMMHRVLLLAVVLLLHLAGCSAPTAPQGAVPVSYFDSSGRDDILGGGVKMIPIQTPKGVFHVWTKRIGNNPKIKVLLLHGGPGATHEYFEAFDSYFPKAGIEYY
jgi:proline iminopeptidase